MGDCYEAFYRYMHLFMDIHVLGGGSNKLWLSLKNVRGALCYLEEKSRTVPSGLVFGGGSVTNVVAVTPINRATSDQSGTFIFCFNTTERGSFPSRLLLYGSCMFSVVV